METTNATPASEPATPVQPQFGEPWRLAPEMAYPWHTDNTVESGPTLTIMADPSRGVHGIVGVPREGWDGDNTKRCFLRAIACVNALAGIPDPAAHAARLAELLTALREAHRILKPMADQILSPRNNHIARCVAQMEAAIGGAQ